MTDTNVSAPDEQGTAVPENTPAPVENNDLTDSAKIAPEERLIPQSQVSAIAAREKRTTEKRFQEQLAQQEAFYKAELERARKGEPSQNDAVAAGQMSEEQVRRYIAEQAHYMSVQQQSNAIAEQFTSKVNAVIAEDPSFGELFDDLNVVNYPGFVQMANELDNTGEVIREICNNPEKFAVVLNLLNSGSPGLARRQLQKLSTSIKTNQAAKKQPVSPELISQIKPSTTSTSDGAMSINDFKKIYRG